MTKEKFTFYAPVVSLEENDVLVYFGNNTGVLQNIRLHRDFNARYAVIHGINGRCYAIRSYILNQCWQKNQQKVPENEITAQIDRLYLHAMKSPEKRFLIPFWNADEIFTGYSKEEMGKMLSRNYMPKNVYFDEELKQFIT